MHRLFAFDCIFHVIANISIVKLSNFVLKKNIDETDETKFIDDASLMFLYKYIPNFPRTIARLKALPTIYIVYCRSFLNFAFLLKSLIFLFFSLLNSIKRKKRSQSRTNREFIRVNINFRESFRSSFSEANNHNSNRGNADRHRKRRNWPCNYAARNDCTDPPETLFLPVLRRSFQGTVDFSRKFLGQQLDVVAACIEAG